MKRAARNPPKRLGREERERMCTRKRRYSSQGDALDAALLAGVERNLLPDLPAVAPHLGVKSSRGQLTAQFPPPFCLRAGPRVASKCPAVLFPNGF